MIKKYTRHLFLLIAAVYSGFVVAQQAPDLPVRSYILTEAESGQVLASKDPDERLAPASITKLMTAYLTFEALENGKLSLETPIMISQNARSQIGSRMFVEVNSQVPVDLLLQGLIVQSGNDAAVALAERVGGSVTGFAQMMNRKAQELGMTNTHYINPTGLPDPEHYTSATDIATLAAHIIKDFPQYYHYYGQKEFTYNKITQQNRNRLLWRNPNVDGLKTGHTEEAGFCLTSSEKRGDLRLIAVVLGAEVKKDRYDASETLLNHGFAQFSRETVLTKDSVLANVPVFKGEIDNLNLVPQREVTLLVPEISKGNITATLDAPRVIAPVKAGQQLGTITVKVGDKIYTTLPAVAANDIPEAGFFKRSWHTVKLWFAD